MREREKRLIRLESWLGSRKEQEEEERRQEEFFRFVNVVMLEEYPAHTWNTLEKQKKLELLRTPQTASESLTAFESELVDSVLRLTLESIRKEKRRRNALAFNGKGGQIHEETLSHL